MPREDGQFKPGQSGNPGGRPKTKLISELLRAKLLELGPCGERTRADGIAEVILCGAESGDIQFVRELLLRVEGKVPEPIEIRDVTDEDKVSEAMKRLDAIRRRTDDTP